MGDSLLLIEGPENLILFQKILEIDSKKFKSPFTFEWHRNRTKIQQKKLHPLLHILINKKTGLQHIQKSEKLL